MSAIDVIVYNVNSEMIMISFFDARYRKARNRMITSNRNRRLDPDPSTIIAVCTFLKGN